MKISTLIISSVISIGIGSIGVHSYMNKAPHIRIQVIVKVNELLKDKGAHIPEGAQCSIFIGESILALECERGKMRVISLVSEGENNIRGKIDSLNPRVKDGMLHEESGCISLYDDTNTLLLEEKDCGKRFDI